MKKLIKFNSRDGLVRMDAERIAYFKASGINNMKVILVSNLSQTELKLSTQLGEEARMFMRVGKRFIVNLDYVYFVNMAKQCLVMSDMKHFAFQLPISKEALR